ncbi:hypothetical protein CVT24_000720 [Panaeolus cyanescens]|uniref:Major facilitator superfamily (MFS) profile domain-containing protein n=1 Tax=Panaeolus cyanescens TaxID=181874 RepID=A0A409YT92_9AGAR|nr:hypothetical protein CVT24_000720 [Panaeolus cyanescens]
MAGLERDAAILPAVATDIKKSDSFSIEKSPVDHELEDIHDGLVFPTEEEKLTLRRIPDAIPWNAYLIAFVELAERFSALLRSIMELLSFMFVFEINVPRLVVSETFCTTQTNYLMKPLPNGSRTGAGGEFGQSGALGLGQRTMNGITTFNSFWVYIVPLFGAYIADTFWGRYKTICVGLGIALVGHILLIISAVPGVIDSKGAVGAFIIAIIIMGIGTGFFKANISPLVAEQYKRSKMFVITTKDGERVIVDPTLTHSRVYMFVGFYLSYTLPTVVFLCCPIVLYIGRNRYVKSPPTGSVLATALRAWKFCTRGKWSLNPVRTWKNFRAPGFWEPVKPSNIRPEERQHWMTFDDVWVDEVQRGFKACGVFCWYPLYWLTYNQLNANLTAQAAEMSTHGLPNDILSNLDPLALVILIPICDRFIYPGLRRMGLNFSSLKKITLGFFTGSAAMIWAAVVQHYIYKTNPCGYHAADCSEPKVSPLNVWIQSGAYILIAISEILASITGLEYAFTKAPKNMRSLVMSVFLFTSALASALGEAFVALSEDPLLVWNYGTMAVIAGVSGLIFWFSVRDLDAREDELNNMDAGHLGVEHESKEIEKA